MSTIFAGPPQRGALFRFTAPEESAVSSVLTSVNSKDLSYANSVRNHLLATSRDAASRSIIRNFHSCANWPEPWISSKNSHCRGSLLGKEQICIHTALSRKIRRIGCENQLIGRVPTPRNEGIKALLNSRQNLPSRKTIARGQTEMISLCKTITTLKKKGVPASPSKLQFNPSPRTQIPPHLISHYPTSSTRMLLGSPKPQSAHCKRRPRPPGDSPIGRVSKGSTWRKHS